MTTNSGYAMLVAKKLNDKNAQEFRYILNEPRLLIGRDKNQTPDKSFFALGNDKSISRTHAELSYNNERQCYILDVFGKNGVSVDGIHRIRESKVKLSDRSRLQIGDYVIFFVLPSPSLSLSPPLHHSPASVLCDTVHASHTVPFPPGPPNST